VTQRDHLDCPHCGHKECYSENEDLNVFQCFSCGKKGRLKYEQRTYEEGITLEPYIPQAYRGISKATLEKAGVYFTKDGQGKETVHYAYPNGVKHRELPKNIRASGKLDKFYGQDDYNGGGGNITITEGEEDRLSVIQMMGDWPCVSVPGASPSKDFWVNAQEYLKGFEKIYLSLDNDVPGDKLAEKFYRMFPGKTYRVKHTKYKDANEFLTNGGNREFKSAWWNAQRMKPESILSTSEDFLKLYDDTPDYEYFPTGIDGLDEKMLGIHKGAFTVILAPTGVGKTELMRYLEWQCFTQSDYSFGMCHLEETQLRSLLGLVSYDLNENVTRKDLVEAKDLEGKVRDSLTNMASKERVYQFSFRTEDSVDDLIENIRFLVTAMGVDYIFLEPIQDVVTGDVANKESLLTDLTNKLKRLAPELNVGIVVIAHANDDGEAKYCRSIVQGAAYEIKITRDQDSADEAEKNTTHVHVGRKNRTGGGSGYAGSLTFDLDTYTLTPEIGPQEPVFDKGDVSNDYGF
jgi:5S rRNA maturation endonuclease (ribonuclease M5)